EHRPSRLPGRSYTFRRREKQNVAPIGTVNRRAAALPRATHNRQTMSCCLPSVGTGEGLHSLRETPKAGGNAHCDTLLKASQPTVANCCRRGRGHPSPYCTPQECPEPCH